MDTPVVCLLGPRQSGKTTLARSLDPDRGDISLDEQNYVQLATVDNYIAVLERLFLVRRLPAWHNNPGHRLIKTPKIHVIDSGLAATLAD